MNKKIKILIMVVLVILLIIASIILIKSNFTKSDSNKNEDNKTSEKSYKKNNYLLSISITKILNNEENNYNINVEKDDKIQKINADYDANILYYQNNKLIYKNLEEDAIYNYETEYNYSKILPLLHSLALNKESIINKNGDKKIYQVNLSQEFIQDLFKNLFIVTEINYAPDAEITIDNKKIIDFSLNLMDEEMQNGLKINISYDYLDDEYRVADSEINNHYKQEVHKTKDGGVIGPPSDYTLEEKTAESNILELKL